MTEPEIRADEREKIAVFVRDFSWILPLYGSPERPEAYPLSVQLNEASDDAACSVCEQIAAAIRALAD
jgi:hypothetical protein